MPAYVFGSISALLLLTSSVMYARSLRRDPPNPVPVTLTFLWSIVNALTYGAFTSLAASMQPVMMIVGGSIILTATMLSLRRRGWAAVKHQIKFNWIDLAIAVSVLLMIVVWQSVDPVYANWFGQVAIALTFIAFIKQAWVSRSSMNHWPWVVGWCSFVVQVIAVWPLGGAALVMPCVGLLRHSLIVAGILLRPRVLIEETA